MKRASVGKGAKKKKKTIKRTFICVRWNVNVEKHIQNFYFHFITSAVLSSSAVNVQCGASAWLRHQKCTHTIWSAGLTAVYEQQVAMFCCSTIAYFPSKSWKTGQTEVEKENKLPEKETVPLIYLHRRPIKAIHSTSTVVFQKKKIIKLLPFQLRLRLIGDSSQSGAFFYNLLGDWFLFLS